MKRLINFLPSVVVTLLALFATGCNHKELCYQHPHVGEIRVEFDWRYAPEANPQGMVVFFYPLDGESKGQYIRYDFIGGEGGKVNLRAGNYLMLCYNNDSEIVQSMNITDYYTHTLYTREGNVLEPIYGNGANYSPRGETDPEKVVICPDKMYGCTATEVTVDDEGVRYRCEYPDGRSEPIKVPISINQVITLYPRDLTCNYTYEIRNVSNLKHVSQMCASLSGMSGTLTITDNVLGIEPVTLPFEAHKGDEKTIVGKFITFGRNPDFSIPNRMNLYVVMDDGNKFVYGSSLDKWDVTSQVINAPDRRNVHIIIDGLDLPQPIENGSGFAPDVDDWNDVNVDISF